ncbi:MAG: sugar-transfer associated ATP-grasp domain-containing protein [Sphingomicrobium sp.]
MKSLSLVMFDSASFPDLATQINGSLFDRAHKRLSFDEARARLFENADHIVFKQDGSGQGKSIHFLDKNAFKSETIERLGSGVFQRRIQQHAFFEAFSDAAVAAVRITTIVEPTGEISPRSAYLCLATGSETHVQGATQIRVPVDVIKGTLAETGLDSKWLECRAHPTSGETFAGKKIPAFKKCVRAVIAHHQRIAFVGSVGWDVVVDSDDELQILEWNGFHNGIGFSEATQGPCFADLGWERFA